MPTPEKQQQLTKIRQLLDQSGGVYFADFSRLPATEMSALRRKLRKESIRLFVAKNRLTRRALIETGLTVELATIMRGPTALVLAPSGEPYAPARRLKELTEQYKDCQIKGAYVEQTLYAAGQFATLANMPTRSESQSQLVGVLMSPVQQLVMVLDGVIRGLLASLEELKSKKESQVTDQQLEVTS
jgi:large subunit ribosomal protein L10